MKVKLAIRLLFLFFIVVPISLSAQERKELQIEGISAKVEVYRDQWGVNHIYAENQKDLFFAQGYLAAKDRLFQFEIWRRQATGTLAEVFGSKELKRDIGARLFKYRGDLDKELNHYHKDGKEIITSFVNGVNTYIEEILQNPDKLPPEFKIVNLRPEKWTPEVVVSRHNGLKGNVQEELAIGRAVAEAGEELVKDLLWFHPKDPIISLDPSITKEVLAPNILELYTAYGQAVRFTDTTLVEGNVMPRLTLTQEAEGSNNWIISGERTETGYPIMANDPHRSITLPSLRYMVHLNAPGWNVIGGGEPEIPGISIGHNDYGAWGLTIYETDAEDLYIYDLNPENLNQYNYKGKWKDMELIEDSIPVKNEKAYPVTLKYTHHGPVTYVDSTLKKAYAIRAGWLEKGAAPYLAALRYNQTKNWRQFRKASKYNLLPGENMIWADKKGNIGWQVVGIVPVRKKNSGLVPVPGDGRYEWDGYLNIKKRPHLKNSKNGFFATANQSVTPADYKYWNSVGYTWADGFRGDRINEVLRQDDKRNLQKEQELQSDYFSIPARTLVPMLNDLSLVSDKAKQSYEILSTWDYVLSNESVAASIYVMWEREIFQTAYSRFVPKNLRPHIRNLQLTKIISWLQNPSAKFEGNSTAKRDEFLIETFEKAVLALEKKLGDDRNHWQYGQEKFKHTKINHPLHNLLPEELKESYSLGPLPRGGYSFVPNSTGYYDNQSSGASFRIIVDLSDWDKTLMINSPGQSGNPQSKYYGNLFELWQENKYFTAYFTKDKILENSDKITLLKPKN